MPTLLDKALNQRSSLIAFTGIIAGVATWMIVGQDIFPKKTEPTGNPETWTREELNQWLIARNFATHDQETTEQLLQRVKRQLKSKITRE